MEDSHLGIGVRLGNTRLSGVDASGFMPPRKAVEDCISMTHLQQLMHIFQKVSLCSASVTSTDDDL